MSERRIKSIFIATGSIFLFLFIITPIFWMIVISFSKDITFLTGGVYQFSLSNYITIITSKSLHMIDYLKNSLVVASITSPIVLIISSFSAYAITRINFAGRRIIPLLVLSISIFPQISIVGYLYRWMGNLGWINSYVALVLPYLAWTSPLALWILLSYFSQIPKELDSAALIDGAKRPKILFPHPLGPKMINNSPDFISKFMLSRTRIFPFEVENIFFISLTQTEQAVFFIL